MNAQRSSPIAINRGVTHRRVRRDTIDSIKDSPSTSNQSEKAELPGLGASTPPSFVPDGTYKHNRVDKYDILEQVEGLNKGNVFKAKNVHNDTEYICKVCGGTVADCLLFSSRQTLLSPNTAFYVFSFYV